MNNDFFDNSVPTGHERILSKAYKPINISHDTISYGDRQGHVFELNGLKRDEISFLKDKHGF